MGIGGTAGKEEDPVLGLLNGELRYDDDVDDTVAAVGWLVGWDGVQVLQKREAIRIRRMRCHAATCHAT